MRLIIVTIIVLISTNSYAAPSITDASATSSSITITGSDFGSTGPTVTIFDDCERTGATADASISTSATIGTWGGTSSTPPKFDSEARSGDYSCRMSAASAGNYGETQFYVDFTGTTEIFLSYAVQVPSGTYFPHSVITGTHTGSNNAAVLTSSGISLYSDMYVGAQLNNITDGSSCTITSHTETTATCTLTGGTENDWDTGDSLRINIFEGAFPDESVWKLAWVRDYENDPDSSPGDDDKCLPTHPWQARLRNDGNDLNSSGGAASAIVHDNGDTWWQWGGWNRYATWVKANAANPATTNGIDWAQGIGEGVEQYTASDTTHPVFSGGTSPYQFTRLHINGWIRPTKDTISVRLLYDDIYLATGANAAARVEIGNNATYSSCTQLAIQTPTSWADGSVTVDFRKGPFAVGDTAYVFVIDADNVASAGEQITIPGGRRYAVRVSE